MESYEEILCYLIKKRSGIDFLSHKELRDKKLLGPSISMSASELVLLYFDVEKKWGHIPEEEIQKGHFDTFNNIYMVIKNQN